MFYSRTHMATLQQWASKG